jgi:hypothetical protein
MGPSIKVADSALPFHYSSAMEGIMADIAHTGLGEIAPASSPEARAAFRWLTQSRSGLLIAWAGIAALLLTAALCVHTFWFPFLSGWSARTYFLAGSAIVWLPLLLLFLDSEETLAEGPRLALPLLTLSILVTLATVSVLPGTRAILVGKDQSLAIAGQVLVVVVLVLVFIPRIVSGAQFASAKKKDMEGRARLHLPGEAEGELAKAEERRRENADAEAVGALLVTTSVVLITILAYAAGRWSDQRGLLNSAGIGISVATIALFAVTVFVDRLPDSPPVRPLRRAMRGASSYFGWLAAFYDAIDTLLVRIGAHAAGMEHRKTRTRYFILASTQTSLCVLAWFLPPPLGLLPAALGFVLALSISRLWSWVEDDRALAVITRFNPKAPIRVGFREDFRDETLLAFIFVLILIPIAMMQAHVSQMFGGPLFENSQENKFGAWIGYLGFELAKALPVVDWADIYSLSGGEDVMRPTRPIGMHAVFAARAMVDLVLIAALLQAISISSRNRQQKALYAVNQIQRLDEIIERRELARVLARPEAEWFDEGVIDFRHYDRPRLNELRSTSHDPRVRVFVERILKESGERFEAAVQVLARLANHRASEAELADALKAVQLEHDTKEHVVSAPDLVEVLDSLRNIGGLKAIKTAIIDLSLRLEPAEESADLLELTMFGAGRDRFQYTRLHAAKALTDLSARLNDRERVRELLHKVNRAPEDTFGARVFVPNALRQALQERLRELA